MLGFLSVVPGLLERCLAAPVQQAESLWPHFLDTMKAAFHLQKAPEGTHRYKRLWESAGWLSKHVQLCKHVNGVTSQAVCTVLSSLGERETFSRYTEHQGRRQRRPTELVSQSLLTH